ncbi:MAG: transposase [Mycobacteriaceae bacterium]
MSKSVYSAEFKADVVAVVRRGEASLPVIAKDFGVGQSAVRRWVKQAELAEGSGRGVSGDGSIELQDLKELRELRKRNRVMEQELEILRRAAAYFAQVHLPGK